MKLVALLACLAPAVLGSAAAQEPQPPPPPDAPPPPAAAPARARPPVYIGASIGMYKPGSDTTILDTFDFSSGLDLQGFIGIPLNRFLAIEGGIGYYKSSTDTLTAFDPSFGTASVDFELSVMPITASLRAGGAVDRVTLYGLVGVGLHMTELKVNVTSDIASGSISEDDDVFGWHLGAGLAVAVTPRLSLGAEIRRTFVSAEYPELLGPDALGAPTTELTLDGLHIGATLAFSL